MTTEELLAEIQAQQELMIAVATGRIRLEEKSDAYNQRRARIRQGLSECGLADPNPHADLWRWYGKWKTDLPRYQDRRDYVGQLYDDLRERLERQPIVQPHGTAEADGDPFTALARRVTDQQRALLTAILDEFRQAGEWPLARVVHAAGDKALIRAALEDLGGAVVYEVGYPPHARYELTLLGVLLSRHGDAAQAFLARYLTLVRNTYRANPQVSEFRSEQVQQALGLSAEETQFLGFLIGSGHFWTGGGYGPDGWSAQLPANIDDFPTVRDFVPLIRANAMQDYAPGISIDVAGRQQYFARVRQSAAVLAFGEEQLGVAEPETTPTEEHLMKNVFIVHGHDEAKKWELNNFLNNLGLNPIILQEQPNIGKTLIEKFEYYAGQCSFAFVLMTPDDLQPTPDSSIDARWRTRQNVILELGWCMAKLSRSKVVLLYKGEIELPTDLLGIAYHAFDKSIMEVSEAIRRELTAAGLLT